MRNYCKQVFFQLIELPIKYLKDLKIVEQNNPNTSAGVFAYLAKSDYLVTTLIEPNTPLECHDNLPEDLRFESFINEDEKSS